MKAVAQILYEVDINEVLRLPMGHNVLQKDTQYPDRYSVLIAQIDEISANTKRYKYYLFTPPAIKIAPEYLVKDEA